MSLSFLSPPDKGRAESPIPGFILFPVLQGLRWDQEWEPAGRERREQGVGSGTPCLSGLLLVRLALDHEPVMGATAKGVSRAREERMEEEIFFLDLIFILV